MNRRPDSHWQALVCSNFLLFFAVILATVVVYQSVCTNLEPPRRWNHYKSARTASCRREVDEYCALYYTRCIIGIVLPILWLRPNDDRTGQ